MYLLLNYLADGDISRMGHGNLKSTVDVSFTSLQGIILLIPLNSSWCCYNLCLNPRRAYSERLRARRDSLPAGVAWADFHKDALTSPFSLLDAAAVL